MVNAPLSSPRSHAAVLSLLSQAPAREVKHLAEAILADLEALGVIRVERNRSGLVMLPYRDTVQGTLFHLGEALIAEGHVTQTAETTLHGYGACLGRDLEQAMALALIDLAWQRGAGAIEIAAFLERARLTQASADLELQRQTETTRVQMETF